MSTLVHSTVETQLVPPWVGSTGPTRLQEAAAARLRVSGYYAVRLVTCEYREGVLILRGRSPSFYLKQVAQEAVARLDGVEEISNRIEVIRPDRT